MARQITSTFLEELKTGSLNPLLSYVQNDNSLDLELRGNSVIIYYRGGKILEIKEDGTFIALDEKYLLEKTAIKPSLIELENYFSQAKYIIDYYVANKRNHLWEKEIQQRIVQENNYSPNSSDTDFFVIDMEYQDIGRADIVALCWKSTSSARKLQNNYLPKITIFEVKQGFNSISGKSGMYSHLKDFNNFLANETKINDFKQDMISVFHQKRELGLIKINNNPNQVTEVAKEIDFVFLLTNYKSASKQLEKELKKIDSCQFIYANPMGYSLYAKNIIDKQRFTDLFL